jgi:hypothetical protein
LDEGNSLKEYLVSLDKVYDLEVNIMLPGHGASLKILGGGAKGLRNIIEKELLK